MSVFWLRWCGWCRSSKVRDIGVVFDQYLTFHDHIKLRILQLVIKA